jgi:acylphosphatase
MKRVMLVVKGRVQGVFYREFASRQADELGLRGYVRNMPDGTVEAVAEGDEASLKELVRRCWKGSSRSDVSNVEVKWAEPTGEYTAFSVRF